MNGMLLLGVVLAVAGQQPNTEPKGAAPSARDILKRMAQVYRTCRSYRDTGSVTIAFTDHTDVRPFRTAFVRPHRFRFEYTEVDAHSQERMVVWSDPRGGHSWWTLQPKVESSPTLEMPIAGATGVSGGSAHTIPRLLMPEGIGGWALTDLQGVQLVGSETLHGVVCHKLVGRDLLGDPVTVWIGQRSYLVLRIAEHSADPLTDTTTAYKPEINVSIAARELAFTPPGSRRRTDTARSTRRRPHRSGGHNGQFPDHAAGRPRAEGLNDGRR